LIVYCADVGSIQGGRFGWARGDGDAPGSDLQGGTDIQQLAEGVADDLDQGRKVTPWVRGPLLVPLREEPKDSGRARNGATTRVGLYRLPPLRRQRVGLRWSI
jgi:hypothetical protein